MQERKGKLYAIFVDYQKAFDQLDRNMLMEKLEGMIGNGNYLTRIIGSTLEYNLVTIQDGTTHSSPIKQTNGVLQGDPLSPLLFNLATADVRKAVNNTHTSLYTYADDMVLAAKKIEDLQESFNQLIGWAEDNNLKLNKEKTVQMTFRKGGRRKTTETITLKGEDLTVTNAFKYLGVTIQTTGNTFGIHVKEKAITAIRAINDIGHIQQISLEVAMKLFRAKIVPILTHGVHLIWENLKKRDLKEWERVKATFLKRVIGVSKFTPSRYVYILTREPFLMEDLHYALLLPATEAYRELMAENQRKRRDIEEDFYATSAMTDRRWTGPNQNMRNVVTRLAVHGFHHKVCRINSFHVVMEKCVCKFCGHKCEKYHVLKCNKCPKTVTELSGEN